MPANIAAILGVIFAIVATVLAVIFILPESRARKMNKFLFFLHNLVNFRALLIDKILKVCYIFSTCTVVLIGFFMLFSVEEVIVGWGDVEKQWLGLTGLLLMIFGPIVVRIAYEFMMMFVLLVGNVNSINGKLADKDRDEHAADRVKQPKVEANYVFCTQCGERYNAAAGNCPKCGGRNQ